MTLSRRILKAKVEKEQPVITRWIPVSPWGFTLVADRLATFPTGTRKGQVYKGPESQEGDKVQLMTVQEVGEMLSISRAGVYRLVRSGGLPFVRFHDRADLRFDPEDVQKWVQSRKAEV